MGVLGVTKPLQNAYASPLAFKQAFNVNDKAFFWMAASSLCRRKEFAQVEKLLTAKKMLVSQKLVCPVPWPAFFQLVAKYGPPGEASAPGRCHV